MLILKFSAICDGSTESEVFRVCGDLMCSKRTILSCILDFNSFRRLSAFFGLTDLPGSFSFLNIIIKRNKLFFFSDDENVRYISAEGERRLC